MKVIVHTTYGDASVLKLENRSLCSINEDEVLIKVAAAGLNRADIAQRKGNYPAPKNVVQDILGLEVSGEIVEVGSRVSEFQLGDKVCALLAGGGYAEYVAVDVGSCLPIPKGISLEDASAIPEALFTVWHNIFQRGKLEKGQNVLIYGASGGIGSMAIQLINLYGANAYAVVSNKEKADYCLELGAKKTINYKEQNIVEILGKESIDLILDVVGGEYLNSNIDLLKKEGRLVYINAMEGGKVSLNIFKVMQKRLHLTGSTLRARSNDFKRQLAKEIYKEAYPLLESGKFKNIVKHRFSVEEVIKAHQLMESRDFYGKIIICF